MLKDAFDAGGNIVLLRDVELTETLKLPKEREINLDLNGFVIDGREKVRIAIMSYGDLTLKDSSAGKTGVVKAGVSSDDGKHVGNTVNVCAGTFTMLSGSIYSLNNAILIDEESAEVSIKGGTITAEPTTFNSAGMYISSESDTVVDITGGTMTGYNGILLWNNTKITMTGGSIDARGRLGIQGNGSCDNTELYISGNAEVRGADAAIYHPQGGILVIEDNAVLTGGTGIIVKGGNVTIAGGTISGTGEAVDYGPVGSGYNGTGDALYVEHFDNIPNSENYGTPVVAVTGGSFNSLNGKPIASYANPANESAGVAPLKQFVSGGMFNAQIEDSLCASGYECKDNNNDGVYGVVVVDVVAFVGWSSYKTFAAAVEAATNEVVRLAASATFSESLTVDRPLRIDLNGKTLTKGEGGLFTIDGAVVTIDGGGLSGFSNADITLAGNAILTVTDADVAASFRTDANYYVSQNANGTHSIMLKNAFRVFITVVDGEPRIGFFKDCDTEKAPTAYTVKGATNLETPEWTTVDCVDASDAAAASELPLHWVKPAAGSGFRFFKLSAE